MTRYSSLLLSFILMALPLQADDDIFNMGLQKELAVKIGANPFHWDGKITVGEFDLITGIFTRGERLYFVSGSGAYAPIAGVAWNTSRNDEHVAAFVGAIENVEAKNYPTYFSGKYQPGQGKSTDKTDLAWQASALGVPVNEGEEPVGHAYWNVSVMDNDRYFTFSINGKNSWNAKDDPFNVQFRASNTKTHKDLKNQVAADCVLKKAELGASENESLGFFYPKSIQRRIAAVSSTVYLSSTDSCDKCTENTYYQRWASVLDFVEELYVCYPEWNKNNADVNTIVAWNAFAQKARSHEHAHYSDYARIYGDFVSKWGGKEWNIRACFGPDGLEEAKDAIRKYRALLESQYSQDARDADAKFKEACQAVEDHREYGRDACNRLLNTTSKTSDVP